MNKIIGFVITRSPIDFEWSFRNHFNWLRFGFYRFGEWHVGLWGHGDFDTFIQHGDATRIIVGYSDYEHHFLGTSQLRNRGAVIRIHGAHLEVENDVVGAFRIYYADQSATACIASMEDLVLQAVGQREIDQTNLVQYLLVGHMTGRHTIYRHVKAMEANQRLSWDGSRFTSKSLPPLEFKTIADPVATLHRITKETIERYSAGYDRLFLPLSGGYDSRMLAANAAQPQNLVARTYGYSYPLDQSYEVARAAVIAKRLGIADWQAVDLGPDYIADHARAWFDIFGTSHHLHGMYHMEFYHAMRMETRRCLPTLSGYVGDVVAGNQIHDFLAIADSGPVAIFKKAQYQGQIGFTPQELRQLLTWDIEEDLATIGRRWTESWEEVEGEPYQKFILTFLRQRGRTHISYLCTLADLYGGAITPFIDREYLTTTLSLPVEALRHRTAQEEVFKRFFPDVWLDESKFPKYEHYLNFLAIKARRMENIYPIVSNDGLMRLKWFNTEYVEKVILGDFNKICTQRHLLHNQWPIRTLYLCNILQPLYFSGLEGKFDIKYRGYDHDADERDGLEPDTPQKANLSTVAPLRMTFTSLKGRAATQLTNKTASAPRLTGAAADTHYDAGYFDWQKNIGAFGGKANLFKFREFVSPGHTLIDFGCGGGYLLARLDARNKFGIEINAQARQAARRQGLTVVSTADEITNGIADLIVSNHALEHVDSPLETLRRLRCKLKPDGKAVFVVPHQGPLEEYCRDDINQHLYTWNPLTLGNLFKAAGFRVENVETIQHQWPPDFQDLFEKHGEEGFHEICREFARKNNNYQIRIVARNPVSDSDARAYRAAS